MAAANIVNNLHELFTCRGALSNMNWWSILPYAFFVCSTFSNLSPSYPLSAVSAVSYCGPDISNKLPSDMMSITTLSTVKNKLMCVCAAFSCVVLSCGCGSLIICLLCSAHWVYIPGPIPYLNVEIIYKDFIWFAPLSKTNLSYYLYCAISEEMNT